MGGAQRNPSKRADALRMMGYSLAAFAHRAKFPENQKSDQVGWVKRSATHQINMMGYGLAAFTHPTELCCQPI